MRRNPIAILLLSASLTGCASVPSASQRPNGANIPPTNPVFRPTPRPEAQVMSEPGLEGVIGAAADPLLRMFGEPRLDLYEGDVRKLQFSGEPCVLDIYLYPPTGGGPPVATHVDARRASDGRDVDRAACVSALRRR